MRGTAPVTVVRSDIRRTYRRRILGVIKRVAGDIKKVASNSVFQAVVTVAACSTGVGCGIVSAGFFMLNAYNRGERYGFTSANFFEGTALDAAMFAIPVRNLRDFKLNEVDAFTKTPNAYVLINANRTALTANARAMLVRRNMAWGGVMVARGQLPW